VLEAVWRDVWYPRRVLEIEPERVAFELPEPAVTFGRALSKIGTPEAFVFPQARDWLAGIGWLDEAEGLRGEVERFRRDLQRWTRAVVLPVDELLLTLGNDLFRAAADLALTHRLAVLLAKLAGENPSWRLPELANELTTIARNERRFIGFADDDTGFDPDKYRGQVVVATMHKAKGLEWDRVYLLSTSNYDFPSAQPYDEYIGEKWFIRGQLNLEAEALAQLLAVADGGDPAAYREGDATREARLDYVRERLRLLYVGVTRARKELVITWNTGRKGDRTPALPLVALQVFSQRREA